MGLRKINKQREAVLRDEESIPGSIPLLVPVHHAPAYCHPAYLTYMQSISCEMLGWMKNKLESRLLGEISVTSNMQMKPPLWQKVKKK